VLKIDRTTSLFLQGLIKWTSLAFIASLILKLFGIHLAGMDGLLASVGIALGLASQRVLQNLAAGITLLLFRPFKVGDKVVLPSGKGHAEGYVKDILLFETRVLTADKRLISIPNAAIYADGHIENLYGNRVRRVEILVQTAGMTNVTDARRVLEEAILPYAYLAEDRSEEDKSAEREQSKGLAGSIVRRSKEKIKKHLSGLHMPGGVLRAEVPDMIVAMTSFYMMQRAKPQADPPNPPRVVMIGMSQVGTNWLCFVWVPCREYDKWKLTVTEVIAKALQANKIRTVAQMVDQAAMNGVVLPNVFE
jgi:small-conductance mechanosensitive channel